MHFGWRGEEGWWREIERARERVRETQGKKAARRREKEIRECERNERSVEGDVSDDDCVRNK